jgi:hypothetical protein
MILAVFLLATGYPGVAGGEGRISPLWDARSRSRRVRGAEAAAPRLLGAS